MGQLNLITNTATCISSSIAALASLTDTVSIKIEVDGSAFLHVAGIGGGGNASFSVWDGTSTQKFLIHLSGDGAGNVEVYAKFRPGGDEAHSGYVVAADAFTAGVPYYICMSFDQSSHAGVYAKCRVMNAAGTLIGTPGDITYAPGSLNASTGIVLINDQSVQKMTGKIGGLAIYSTWLSGADEYSAPAAGDTGLICGWLLDETSGNSAANLVGGGAALEISGIESTNFAWGAGGNWNSGVAGAAADVAVATAALTTAIKLGGSAADVASSSAGLITAIRLALAAVVNAAAAGALSTAKPLAASALDVSTASGSLVAGAVLQGAALDVVVAVASLSTAIRLGASADDVASSTGVLINFASVTLAGTLYTGAGGILDPNFWVDDVPTPGTTIYFDPTHITVYPNGEISADTNNCVALVQFTGPNGLALGLIIITPNMVAYADSEAAAAGQLSTAIRLAAAANAVAVVAAALGTGAGLRADSAAIAVATGSVLTSIPISALASTISASAAALVTAIRMAANNAAVSTSTASLNQYTLMNAAAIVTSASSAALQTQIRASASAVDQASASGDMSTAIDASAAMNSVATALAALSTGIRLGGAAIDQAEASASLRTIGPLFAAAIDAASATALLDTGIDISANAQAVFSAGAQLVSSIDVFASAMASASSVAALSDVIESPPIGIYSSDPLYTVSRPRWSFFSARRTPRFGVKRASEPVVLTFDFSAQLQGTNLQGPISRTISAVAGFDASASSLFVYVPSYDMTKTRVLQKVSGGIAGVYYYLTISVTTTDGRQLSLTGLLPVQN